MHDHDVEGVGEFYTVVWCPDCKGQDFEGCFGGDVERLGPFDTREEANRAGVERVGQSIWKYEVEWQATA